MTRVLYRTALALLLTANAAGLAVLVSHGGGLPPLLGAVSLAYLGLVVLGYAVGAAWHAGNASGCHWNRRRCLGYYSHAARSAAVRTTPPAEVHAPPRHAAAMAEVAASPMRALPPTQPLPVVEITQTAPTWGLDGRRVVEEVGR